MMRRRRYADGGDTSSTNYINQYSRVNPYTGKPLDTGKIDNINNEFIALALLKNLGNANMISAVGKQFGRNAYGTAVPSMAATTLFEKNGGEVDDDELETQSYKDGGIHIKKANRGKFTAKANRAGQGVQQYASHVLANKEDYPASTIKQANFAKNAAGWKHAVGGTIQRGYGDSYTWRTNSPTYNESLLDGLRMPYGAPIDQYRMGGRLKNKITNRNF